MSTLADRIVLFHNLARIKREYPGIDRILTSEKISAYDRGEYDDLEEWNVRLSGTNVPVQDRGGPLEPETVETIVGWYVGITKEGNRVYVAAGVLREDHLREYEAEIISRYKAGLL